MLEDVAVLDGECASLSDALGRVLREPVTADRDQPPFERSAMDGFAVSSGEWQAGRSWRIAGSVPAGAAWDGDADPARDVVRIATGSAVPSPFDAVVQVELAEVDGETVRFTLDELAPWRNVHRRGADAAAGAILIAAGTRLGPHHLALAATAGVTRPPVTRRPRVVVLSSGDEVVDPATATADLTPQQIRNSNGPLLTALLTRWGADLLEHRHVPDTAAAVTEACRAAAGRADLVVTAGGVSVGERDLFPDAWRGLGFSTRLHGVAMQPGKPVLSVRGRVSDPGGDRAVHVLGLPGNPVSVLVTAHLFVWPLLRTLGGDPALLPWRRVWLAEPVRPNPKRAAFRPARLVGDARDQAAVLAWRGSGDLSHTAAADGLLALPATARRADAGPAAAVPAFRPLNVFPRPRSRSPVNLRVLYFAALADTLGVREQILVVGPGARVADAWAALVRQHPALAAAGAAPVAFAVNLEYATSEQLLSEGDELALIPPVSGG